MPSPYELTIGKYFPDKARQAEKLLAYANTSIVHFIVYDESSPDYEISKRGCARILEIILSTLETDLNTLIQVLNEVRTGVPQIHPELIPLIQKVIDATAQEFGPLPESIDLLNFEQVERDAFKIAHNFVRRS